METTIENPTQILILDFFKSLTNEDRLKIIGVLALEKLNLEQLSNRVRLPRAEVSHHLENLTDLGLIRSEGRLYRLDTTALEAMARQTLAGQLPRTDKESFDGDDYERKVLADFFTPEGKLKSFPAQFKKLMVILRYLADKEFKPGVRYPEKEVNAALSHYHLDTASLRRYMVDNHFLGREKGEYWKLEPAT
jgi:hypothetical protein